MQPKKNLRIAYGTASERKAAILYSALSGRYESVWMVYEHGREFTIRTIDGDRQNLRTRGLPPLPRYLVLFWQHAFTKWLLLLENSRRRFDAVISEGIQLTLFLIPLRKFGLIRNLVYFAQDWFPNHIVARMLDRVCCWGADQVWDLTPAIAAARRHRWKHGKPDRVLDSLYGPVPLPKRAGTQSQGICYLGALRPESGIDTILDAFGLLKKQGKTTRLDLIGKPLDDAYLESLKAKAADLGVEESTTFHGFLSNDEMAGIVQSSLAGLAFFPGGGANYSNYGVIGKVREYVENGIPVLLSKSSAMAPELVNAGAALTVDDDPAAIARAISELLDDPGLRDRMHEAAYAFAQKKSDPAPYYEAIEDLVSLRSARP